MRILPLVLAPAMALMPLAAQADVALALRHADAMPVVPGDLALALSLGAQGDAGALLPLRMRIGLWDRIDAGVGAYVQYAEGFTYDSAGASGKPYVTNPGFHIEASGTAAVLRSQGAVLSLRLLADRNADGSTGRWKLAGGVTAAARTGDFLLEAAALCDTLLGDTFFYSGRVLPEASARASWVAGSVVPSVAVEIDSTPGPVVDSTVMEHGSRILGGPGLAMQLSSHVRLSLDLRIGRNLSDFSDPPIVTYAGVLGIRVDLGHG